MKKTYKITGMHCSSCASLIELELEDIGVKASCSWAKQTLEVEINAQNKEETVKSLLEKAGYQII